MKFPEELQNRRDVKVGTMNPFVRPRRLKRTVPPVLLAVVYRNSSPPPPISANSSTGLCGVCGFLANSIYRLRSPHPTLHTTPVSSHHCPFNTPPSPFLFLSFSFSHSLPSSPPQPTSPSLRPSFSTSSPCPFLSPFPLFPPLYLPSSSYYTSKSPNPCS